MKRINLTMLLVMLLTVTAQAQNSRQYIKDQIKEWGSCRNVAITKYGGDLALNQNNAYAFKSIPNDLADIIRELHRNKEYIDDIQLTENGKWLVLYGDNGLRWNNIPYRLEQKLRDYNKNNEVITSVALNDVGDWIVVTEDHVAASDDETTQLIKEGIEKWGTLWTAHLTDDGLVLVFENGYKYRGNVPQRLKDKLSETEIDVYRLKFLDDGTYFIADKDGTYSYWM